MNNILLQFLAKARTSNQLADYYQIDLSSYCTGHEGKSIDFCSKPAANFWFNPVEVWGLQDSGLEDLFPKELQDGLNTYRAVAHWMYVAYVIAFWATVAEAVIGLFATFSRIISLVTSFVAGVSSTLHLSQLKLTPNISLPPSSSLPPRLPLLSSTAPSWVPSTMFLSPTIFTRVLASLCTLLLG